MLFSKIITLSKSGEYSFSPSMRFTPHGRAESYCASVVSVSVAEVVLGLNRFGAELKGKRHILCTVSCFFGIVERNR